MSSAPAKGKLAPVSLQDETWSDLFEECVTHWELGKAIRKMVTHDTRGSAVGRDAEMTEICIKLDLLYEGKIKFHKKTTTMSNANFYHEHTVI